MFDYQAGEKYKLTLIMTAIAGALAGIFLTLLFMPTEAPQKQRQVARHANDPDVTGYRQAPGSMAASAAVSGQSIYQGAPQQRINPVDPLQARQLIDGWLPMAWDLSAGTAKQSQERALAFMTPECASSYKQNIWTDAVASQIEQSGLQSSFTVGSVDVGGLQADGSIVVTVTGNQMLGVGGRVGKSRSVKVEYLIKQLPEGLRIAGISETGRR